MDIAAVRSMVWPIGIGTIWCGRQWPPGNAAHTDATQAEVDAHLDRALELFSAASAAAAPSPAAAEGGAAEGAAGGSGSGGGSGGPLLMVDTAEGYGLSEERVGSWLHRRPEARDRVVVATKFGERFDGATGATAVNLSAEAAERCLAESERLLGRVDILYSHVTSQVTDDAASAVLRDNALLDALRRMRASGRVGAIGASVSHEAVVLEAVGKGWFDALDAVQLPAPLVLKHPGVAERLDAAGKLVVVNSPVRKMGSLPGLPATPEAAFGAVLGARGVRCCLTGTRRHLDETMAYARR